MRVTVLKMSAAVAIMVLGAFGAAVGSEPPDRPLDLEDCVALAHQYNPSLTVAHEGVMSALLGISAVLFDPGDREANVEAAPLTVETARESVGTAEKEVVSAEAQLAAATGKYREGVGIFVEILDAQESVARARTNNVRAIYEYRIALVALQRAMGLLVPGTEVEL